MLICSCLWFLFFATNILAHTRTHTHIYIHTHTHIYILYIYIYIYIYTGCFRVVPPALSRSLAKGRLPRVSRQSCWLVMIRVIMKWSWGLCTDLLAFALQLRKTRKTSARRPSDEGSVQPVIASNRVPFLQMRSVGSQSMPGRENLKPRVFLIKILPVMF